MYDAEYQACSGGNSVEIVQCLAAKTRAHDARLNASFKAAMGHVDAPQRELLRQAQRLWIQYRDANCRLYGASEGSLREIAAAERSEEHTSELQSLMRISYAVFCLKKKTTFTLLFSFRLTYQNVHITNILT